MKIDKSLLDQLGALDDKTLSALIRELGRKAGADERSTMRAAANVGILRRKVASMSSDDINKALSSVDDGKLNEVISDLKKRGIVR